MNAHAGAKTDPTAEPTSESGSGRGRYHHGDLANALTREGVALAREGGPDAVVLREAARRVGVSPAAAYRHFAGHDELRYAVKLQAQQELADAMDAALLNVESMADPAPEALRRLGAIGAAYVHFALDEPGLFRTAFCRAAPAQAEAGESDRRVAPGESDRVASGDWHGPVKGEEEAGNAVVDAAAAGEPAVKSSAASNAAARESVAEASVAEALTGEGPAGGGSAGEDQGADEASAQVNEMLRYRPFQMLSEGLDRLVALGILRPERRPNAEIPAWSMVHGLATLLLDGPLRVDDEAAKDALLDLALRTVVDGLLN
ncbi:MAG TPA: TetR/AcrR family transcriptional regulator [Actinocrinis sp.]|nr:TetR/AcrR family transcriptional regulator [Actinocrinis sp.]